MAAEYLYTKKVTAEQYNGPPWITPGEISTHEQLDILPPEIYFIYFRQNDVLVPQVKIYRGNCAGGIDLWDEHLLAKGDWIIKEKGVVTGVFSDIEFKSLFAPADHKTGPVESL